MDTKQKVIIIGTSLLIGVILSICASRMIDKILSWEPTIHVVIENNDNSK